MIKKMAVAVLLTILRILAEVSYLHNCKSICAQLRCQHSGAARFAMDVDVISHGCGQISPPRKSSSHIIRWI